MIRRVITADLKIEMLRPLLFDEKITGKWDETYGAHGFNLLRMILYFDLIREISAISLDRDSRSPSIHNILQLLQSTDLLNALKSDYCKPLPIAWIGENDEDSKKFWEERQRGENLEDSEKKFDNHLQIAKSLFKELKNSSLFKKIKSARNKLIAHYEMCNDGDSARIFDPTDLELKWSDPEDYYVKIKPIIVELVLLTSNESYSLDTNKVQHENIAKDFWSR